jgi:hypothetical protein
MASPNAASRRPTSEPGGVAVTDAPSATYERGSVLARRVTEDVLGSLESGIREGLARSLLTLTQTGGALSAPDHVRPQRRKQVPAR